MNQKAYEFLFRLGSKPRGPVYGFGADPSHSLKEEIVRKVLEFNFAGSVVQNTVALSVILSMHKRL